MCGCVYVWLCVCLVVCMSGVCMSGCAYVGVCVCLVVCMSGCVYVLDKIKDLKEIYRFLLNLIVFFLSLYSRFSE